MDDEKRFAEFEAGHGRKGYIDVCEATCDVCKQEALCLVIDSSEGEYGEGCICKPCIEKAFAAEDQ